MVSRFLLASLVAFSTAEAKSPIPSPAKYGRVSPSKYVVEPSKISHFKEKGFAVLEDVLNEDEVKEIEEVYSKFMNREIKVPGKDFCDMSKPFDTPFEDYSIINCMLPATYYPALKGNIYEKLAKCICDQIFPDAEMTMDYDQLLNKRPMKGDAIFGWHQDMAYWPTPKLTPDTRTITFSLAIDSTTELNGAIKYVPGSGKDKTIRKHKPLHSSREEGHAVEVEMYASDIIEPACAKRGSCTIHDEYVVHGSGGNDSKGDRRTYVMAFRPKETVEKERSIGFTHSHNDETNWDTFKSLEKDASIPDASYS